MCTLFHNQNHKTRITAVIGMSLWSAGLFVKNVFKNITVEPIVFLYLLNGCTYTIVFQNLQIEKACKVNLNQTADICDNLNDPGNEEIQNEVQKIQKPQRLPRLTMIDKEEISNTIPKVQALVSNIKMYSNLLSTIPAFVCVSFLGPLSDQVSSRHHHLHPHLNMSEPFPQMTT